MLNQLRNNNGILLWINAIKLNYPILYTYYYLHLTIISEPDYKINSRNSLCIPSKSWNPSPKLDLLLNRPNSWIDYSCFKPTMLNSHISRNKNMKCRSSLQSNSVALTRSAVLSNSPDATACPPIANSNLNKLQSKYCFLYLYLVSIIYKDIALYLCHEWCMHSLCSWLYFG